MNRYLRLIWLLVSSLLVGLAGFVFALALMLPFILRYSSDFSQTPQWVRGLMAILGYGLAVTFFTANMIRHWRWADEKVSSSTNHHDQSPSKDGAG
jgi:Sec-independent protein secretion pathway component TatC